MRRFFVARGQVQGVMFRQTLIRGAQNRRLQAGASNLLNGIEVAFTLEGEAEAIAELVAALRPRCSSGPQLTAFVSSSDTDVVEKYQAAGTDCLVFTMGSSCAP
jgi:acylphosphatase